MNAPFRVGGIFRVLAAALMLVALRAAPAAAADLVLSGNLAIHGTVYSVGPNAVRPGPDLR